MTEIEKIIADGIDSYLDLWSYGQDDVTLSKLAQSIFQAYNFHSTKSIRDPDSNFHYGRLCGFCEGLKFIIEYNQDVARFKDTMEVDTLSVITKLFTENNSVPHSDLCAMLQMQDGRLHTAIRSAILCHMVEWTNDKDGTRYKLTTTGKRYLQSIFGFMVKGANPDETCS